MVRTQIQLTETQSLRLKKLASMRDTSVAQLIRFSVDQFLESASLPDEAARRKRAIDLAGKFRSDATDLSTNHDDYLSEAFS